MSTPRIAIAHRIPASVTPLADWVPELCDDVVLVTTPECAAGYQEDFRHIRVVTDYSTGGQVESVLEDLASEGLQRIVSGTEDDVLRVARVREKFGIPGMHTIAARHFIDKYVMKSALAGNVRVPGFAAADDPTALARLCGCHPGPYVIKPRRGYASRDVKVVRDSRELAAELATRDLGISMVEEFIDGEMFHVDGLMRAGRVQVAFPSAYVNNCLSFQQSTPLGSAQLDDGCPVQRELLAFTRAVVATLPQTPLTPFHLEVFRDREQRLVFCEIACRLGGGHIMETFTHKLGTNPVRIWYRDQAGLPPETDPAPAGRSDNAGFLLVPPRAGTVLAIDRPDLPDFVTGFSINTDCPRTFTGASASTDEMLGFVVQGRDFTEVTTRLQHCMSIANEITHWA